MNWNDFLLALLLLYFFYYAVNIFYDLLFSPQGKKTPPQGDPLIMEHLSPPEVIEYVPDGPRIQVSLAEEIRSTIMPIGKAITGGLSLSEIEALCRAEVIVHTKTIAY